MSSRRYPSRQIGRVVIDNSDLPDLVGIGRRTVDWNWHIPPEDLEGLEADRADSPAAPVIFELRVTGLLRVGDAVHGVAGATQLSISAGDWAAQLDSLDYRTPPRWLALVRDAAVRHPSWADAEGRLGPAREQLRIGAERIALAKTYAEFERLVGKAYLDREWASWLPDLPEAKARQLATLLSAQAGLVSSLGRHLGFEVDDKHERVEAPVEYWEAELLLAVSQLLLTYALRLRGQEPPAPND